MKSLERLMQEQDGAAMLNLHLSFLVQQLDGAAAISVMVQAVMT